MQAQDYIYRVSMIFYVRSSSGGHVFLKGCCDWLETRRKSIDPPSILVPGGKQSRLFSRGSVINGLQRSLNDARYQSGDNTVTTVSWGGFSLWKKGDDL